jgi:hypothetical protein
MNVLVLALVVRDLGMAHANGFRGMRHEKTGGAGLHILVSCIKSASC